MKIKQIIAITILFGAPMTFLYQTFRMINPDLHWLISLGYTLLTPIIMIIGGIFVVILLIYASGKDPFE